MRARFSRSFLAQIIGLRVHYKYFEQDDPDLYLSKIKYILENDVEDMEMYFIEEEYDKDGQLVKVRFFMLYKHLKRFKTLFFNLQS